MGTAQKEKEEMIDKPASSGKGKAPDMPDSLVSRIASSATGLARNLTTSSTPVDAAGTLASSTGGGQKAGGGSSSAAQSSRWTDALPTRTNGHISGSHNRNDNGSSSQEGFRNLLLNNTTSTDFDSFTQDFGPHVDKSYVPHDTSLREAEFHQPQASQATTTAYGMSVNYDDGAEVRALLSQPGSLDELEEPVNAATMADQEPDAMDLFGEQFSESQEQVARSIKSTLPAPPTYRTFDANNPLNLRPDYLSSDAVRTLAQDVQDLTFSQELVSGSASLTGAQREHFLAEWDDVLNNYTDVVWGDMLSTVKAAKDQIQAARAGQESLDNNAVARLRMILGHMNSNIQPLHVPGLDYKSQSNEASKQQNPNYSQNEQLKAASEQDVGALGLKTRPSGR